MKENTSLYGKLVGRRSFIRQNDDDFLSGCNISTNSENARMALRIRKALADYATPPVAPDQILWNYTIGQDIGIDTDDSINLVNIAIEMESKIGIKITDDMLKDIKELNSKNSTVRDLINYITTQNTLKA